MRVRPTLQPGHGAAQMHPEIGTVINVMFSKKKKSVFMCGNLHCNKIVCLVSNLSRLVASLVKSNFSCLPNFNT